MNYLSAPEIKEKVTLLVEQLEFKHIDLNRIHCIRSFDAKTRAIARIWGMAKIFQEVAGIAPHYIIEVNAKYFDKQSPEEQIKTLVHELMHIPKTFSGALLSHHGRYHAINNREVEKILKRFPRK